MSALTELKYWLWLTLKRELSARKVTMLLEHFGTPEAVFAAESADVEQIENLGQKESEAVLDKSLRRASTVIEDCKRKNVKILTYDSPYYPELLAKIYDPPYVLYARCRERIDLNEHVTVTVVGTRRASSYGVRSAETLGSALAENGVTLVSGMAKGIDAAAMSGALSAGGKVVAVLGSGVDICYPLENLELMQRTIDCGIVLSEFPPGTPPFSRNFPVRNRIISGLSLGTVVAEAPRRSGALITARVAAEQGRDVFAIPADITRKEARGSNQLIHDGAKPILSVEDVLGEYRSLYGARFEKNRPVWKDLPTEAVMPAVQTEVLKPKQSVEERFAQMNLSDIERRVLSLLSEEPKHIDTLTASGMSAAELSATLTLLEMKGVVRGMPGRQYCLQEASER